MKATRVAACGMPIALILVAYAGAVAPRPQGTPAHAAALGGSALATTDDARLPDPFSIQRVILPPEQREQANRDVARGTLKTLPKSDFEAMVQAAAQVQQTGQNPSRILEATYRATVQAGRVTGNAEWQLIHPTARAGAMPIDPLPGAILSPKWADGRIPILFRATPDGKGSPATYLWAEGAAPNPFAFQWSVRTVDLPEEERCTLTFPLAPISGLELALAADRTLIADQPGLLVTGPFPAPKSDERLWKLSFGGQTRLELAFRKVQPANDEPKATRVARASVWKLSRSEFAGQFEFALDSFQAGYRQRTFQIDSGMQIVQVSGSAVEGWDWQPEAKSLRVRFRDGAPSNRVTISARAVPVALASSWVTPQIRLAGGSLQADTIEVQLSPDFKLEGWQPGDYRLGATATTPDRTTKLEFAPKLLNAEDRVERKSPTIRLQPVDQEYATVETLDWRLEPNRTKLAATFAIKVQRGPIPSFAFQVSNGYLLEGVTLSPDDPGAAFGPQPGAANTWFVEPTRAVGSGQSLEIRLEFRAVESAGTAEFPRSGEAKALALPQVFPLGAADRRGTLTVRPRGGMKISTVGLSAPHTPLVGQPGLSFAYRGREPDGELLVSRAKPAISASSETELTAGAKSIALTTTLKARVEGTPLDSLLVWVPASAAKWQIEPTAAAVRLPGDALLPALPYFGIAHGWSALALAGLTVQPQGSLWRITFARPALGDIACSASWETDRSDTAIIPIPHFHGVPVSAQTAKLDPTQAGNQRVEVDEYPHSQRAYLRLSAKAAPQAAIDIPQKSWEFRDLHLLYRVETGDRLLCALRGTVAAAGGSRLTLGIECERIESILVGGKWYAATARELEQIGLPITRSETEFEVRYSRRLAAAPAGLPFDMAAADPALPGDPAIRRSWWLAPEYRDWPNLQSGDLASDDSHIRLVKDSTVRAASWIAALAVGALAFLAPLGRRYRVRLSIGFALLFSLGSASVLAPTNWHAALLPALAAALAALALAIWRRPFATPLAVALLALGSSSLAQAPESTTVFVVPGPADQPGRTKVLAPKVALEKLAALARSPLPECTLLSADYDGLAGRDSLAVQAKYTVHCPNDGEHPLAIPLAGVRLEKATVDGKPAFPDAGKPDRFSLAVTGAGTHEVLLQFAVAARSTGNEREAKFTAPDLPLSRVGFAAGLRARQLDVASRLGGQTLRVGTEGLRVEAEHGGGRTVHLRWREGGAAEGAKPTITVKEAAIWDLGESESLLTAVWQYRVEGGTVGSLKLDLPEGVIPSHVSMEAMEGTAPGLGIRQWKTGPPAAGVIPLEVRLQSPSEGRFTLILKGYSAKLPSLKPVLAFPRAAEVADVDRDSYGAVRFAGLRSDGVGVNGGIDFPAETVMRDFGKVPEFNFGKSPPDRVVHRAGAKGIELRPSLLPTLAYTPLAGEVSCTLGRRVEIEGAMKVSLRESGIVEFDVPNGSILRDVWSPGLAGWTRTGSRIQAWWAQPAGEVVVRWAGQLPNAPAPNGAVDLPMPRWPSAVARLAEPIAIRVRPAEGWVIAPLPVAGVKSRPSAAPEEWLLTIEPEQNPVAKFTAKLAANPEAPAEKPKPPVKSAVPSTEAPVIDIPAVSTPLSEPLHLHGATWLTGLGAVSLLILFAGRRWHPEVYALLGLTAVGGLGLDSLLSAPFWLLTAFAALWRAARITAGIARSTRG